MLPYDGPQMKQLGGKSTYFFLKHTALGNLYREADFRAAKRILLCSDALSGEEKTLLDKAALRLHPNDGMYVPSCAQHYISVGLSAVRCIEDALHESHRGADVRTILVFPSGYGRVLRFLKVRFPDADITISEIDSLALDFCKHLFSVKSIMSQRDFSRLVTVERFDLIWCGSLMSHIDEKAAADLLRFFYDHLTPAGVCVFTTHGQLSADWMQKKTQTYGMTKHARQQVLSDFHENGYGYADYWNHLGWGISLVSHERMRRIALSVAQWNEAFYREHGWDNHQDVYGFAAPRLNNSGTQT